MPLPYAVGTKYTNEVVEPGRRNDKVWIAQPGSRLDKRKCTLQICFRPNGEQPRIAVIFRGQGKRIAEDGRQVWFDGIYVYFQQNAWADIEFSVAWVEKTLKQVAEKEFRFVLFCDNLTDQIGDNFKTAVSNLGGIVWFDVSNATDLWQPVGGGFAELLKILAMQQHSSWINSDENADKWYNGKISTKEKHILITDCVGAAYKKISSSEYQSFRWRMFEKTGCLITAAGSDNDKIKPEDLHVSPLYNYIEANTALPETPTCEPAAEPDDLQVLYEVTDVSPDKEINEKELVDLQENRCDQDELVGREKEWFIGEIKYFNKKLAKYMVSFTDGSEDYIDLDEIDNVDILLL